MLGPVFRTYEPAHDRLVAVKAFRLDLTPEQAQAFASALQQIADAPLDHPSIVRPIAAGLEGTVAYAASEYVAAESLDVALRHYAPAPIDKVLPFVTQLAGAIDFARTSGIGHGALHPRDVFVTPDEARVTGFGVVQALESLGVRAPVRRPYSAPERVEAGAWDARADVYSLAAIAFELITGRRPVGAEVGPLGETGGPHAEAIAATIERGLADDPALRYPSGLAFAAALEASSRGERTTAAVDEIQAVAEAGAAPIALSGPAERVVVPDEDAQPAAAEDEDIAFEREDDLAEIQLRDDERDPDGAGREGGPSLFDLDRETEDMIPEVQHQGFAPERESELLPLEREAPDSRMPEERFDGSEFVEAFEPESVPVRPPARYDDEPRAEMRERPATGWRPSEATPVAPAEPEYAPAAAPASHRDREAKHPRRPRPMLLPVALTLLLGLFVGFLAGYLVGSSERAVPSAESTFEGETAASEPDAEPAVEQAEPTAADTAPAATPPTAPATGARAAGGAEPAAARPAPPRPAPARGRLVVRSSPAGAQVEINGRRRGTTPLSMRELAAGTYTVRVSRSGFDAQSRRISVPASGSRDITFRLERQPRAAAAPPATFTGALYVDSRPRGARVILDGKPIGTTPMQLGNIRAGAHVVRLELPDHRTWTTSARIVAGETTRVTGSLERLR